MPPPTGVDVDSMGPHSPLGLSRFPLHVFVPVAIGSDRVSFPDEPFPDILAVAGYGADRTSESVMVLDRDVNSLATDLADQGALYTPSMSEPVAVLVLGALIPLGGVDTGEPYLLPGYANPVTVGDIGFPGERARAALSAGAASLGRALPEQFPENHPRRDDKEEIGQELHRSCLLGSVLCSATIAVGTHHGSLGSFLSAAELHRTPCASRMAGVSVRQGWADRRPSAGYRSVRLTVTPASNCRPRACNCRSGMTIA